MNKKDKISMVKINGKYHLYCKYTSRYQVIHTTDNTKKTWTFRNFNHACERYDSITPEPNSYTEFRKTEWLRDSRGAIIRKDATVIDWK